MIGPNIEGLALQVKLKNANTSPRSEANLVGSDKSRLQAFLISRDVACNVSTGHLVIL